MFYGLGAYKVSLAAIEALICETYFFLEVLKHIMYRYMPMPGCLLDFTTNT